MITNYNIVEETEGTALQNNGEIYSICTAAFAVKGNDITLMHSEQPPIIENIIPATCTQDGSQEIVVYCGNCKTQLSRDTQVLTKIGHDWVEPMWNWSDDGKTATVTFTCKNDSSHVEIQEATVTSEVKKTATCTEAGVTTYTATIEIAGESYTSTQDVTDIPATGHVETETVNAKEATCTAEGYTGDKVCKICGEVVEAGEAIAKTAHTFQEGKCVVCEAADPDYVPDIDSPKTGDSSNMMVWIAVILIAGAGMTATIVYSRKKKLGR